MSRSTPTPPSDRSLPSDQVGVCLAALNEDMDKAVDAPVWSLDDARLAKRFREALAVRARMDELLARLVDQVDDRDLGSRAGASSTKAHLVASCRLSGGAAAGLLTSARAMTERTAATQAAWAKGKVTAEQAVLIATAVDQLSSTIAGDLVERAQVDLVEHAQQLSYTQLQVVANHLVEVVDPDGADAVLADSWRLKRPGRCSRPPSVAARGSTGLQGSPAGCPTCSTTC